MKGRGEFFCGIFSPMKRRHVTNPLVSLVESYVKIRKICHPLLAPYPSSKNTDSIAGNWADCFTNFGNGFLLSSNSIYERLGIKARAVGEGGGCDFGVKGEGGVK